MAGKSKLLGAGALGPVSHGGGATGPCDGAGGAGGATGGGSKAGLSQVTVGWGKAWAVVAPGAASAGFSTWPCGARVRCLAARTLCSICDRREEYMERLSTDLRRNTKKIATIPTIATKGPATTYPIGARLSGMGTV